MKDAIIGSISFALSQRPAGALSTLQSCLECLIEARVVITREPTSEFFSTGKTWRHDMLDLLFRTDSPQHPLAKKEVARLDTISRLLNGDWHSHEIVHRCSCSVPCERGQFARILAAALLPKATPLFPRHRWTGADSTLRSILLLAVPHGILRSLIPVWLETMATKSPPSVEQFQLRTSSVAKDIGEVEGYFLGGFRFWGVRSKILHDFHSAHISDHHYCHSCVTTINMMIVVSRFWDCSV